MMASWEKQAGKVETLFIAIIGQQGKETSWVNKQINTKGSDKWRTCNERWPVGKKSK